MDESTLRRWAREALQSGSLPVRRPDRLWGGPGTGEVCALCREPVPREETAFELEFTRDSGATINRSLHFRCFAAWEFEREIAPPDGEPLPGARDVGTIAHRELDPGRKDGQA